MLIAVYRVCIASIFVIVEALRFDADSKEMPLEIAIHLSWASVEVNMAVFSSKKPALRRVSYLLTKTLQVVYRYFGLSSVISSLDLQLPTASTRLADPVSPFSLLSLR